MKVVVRPVEGARDLRSFIDLPYRLHADRPLWVPPLRRDVRALLSHSNPFFEHGDAAYFLARADGAVVGRVAAISNRLHNEVHGDRVGFFGFFECVDDTAVARALLDSAADWVRERDLDTLRGPASFSTNDECGLLVDGFDMPPTLMMPFNPEYYARLLEANGFAKVKDLWAYQGGHPERYVPVPARSVRAVELLQKRLHITLRPLDLKRFDDEVERIKRAYNAMWQRNWGFVPLTGAEIEHMARDFRPVINPDLVPFAEIDGQVVGFGLAIPDLNQILRGNRSGRTFPAALKILWALKRRKIRRARILLLGVLPQFRAKGIDILLWHWIWTRAAEHRIFWGEAGWILEDNPAMNNALQRMSFTHYKTYRMYDRAL